MKIRNPLSIAAVTLGGVQMFFQLAEAQSLLTGRWAALGAIGVAAAVWMVNGYIHAGERAQDRLQAAGTPVVPVGAATGVPGNSKFATSLSEHLRREI